jgi:hypothetical protein
VQGSRAIEHAHGAIKSPNVPVDLNPIEMAVVAEVDLEMARRYDEIAGDATQSPEARRAANEAASKWRERARLFRLEARRLGAEPIVPGGPSASERARAYTGPERRKQERRKGERRRSASGPVGQSGTAVLDRRVNPDRRKGDRRSNWPGAR